MRVKGYWSYRVNSNLYLFGKVVSHDIHICDELIRCWLFVNKKIA